MTGNSVTTNVIEAIFSKLIEDSESDIFAPDPKKPSVKEKKTKGD